ncbi:hypothetical protein Trydic_g1509 [Trypoxylus dichotomus]
MLCYIIPRPVFMSRGHKEIRRRASKRKRMEEGRPQPTQLICMQASSTSCHLQTAAAVTSDVKLWPHFSRKINDLRGTRAYINIGRGTPGGSGNECFPLMVVDHPKC